MARHSSTFGNYPTSKTAFDGSAIADRKIQTFQLSPGDKGIFETLEKMAACVRGEVGPDFAGFQNPEVIQAANAISFFSIFNLPAIEIFEFCQFQIRFKLHPPKIQFVQDALFTLLHRVGDCVSKSVCLATLLAAISIPVSFVVQNPTGREYTHVYCQAEIDGRTMSLDACAQNAAGWRQQLPSGGFEKTFSIF